MTKKIRVLAVASAGGHWVQLLRLGKSWEGSDTAYITTSSVGSKTLDGEIYVVSDASRTHKFSLLLQLIQVSYLTIKLKPDVVITTGASVGFFAILVGKLCNAKTIWVDSIANSESVSLSAQKAAKYTDCFFTQWPHLAENNTLNKKRIRYLGKVL